MTLTSRRRVLPSLKRKKGRRRKGLPPRLRLRLLRLFNRNNHRNRSHSLRRSRRSVKWRSLMLS
jgi:hypothetical protein